MSFTMEPQDTYKALGIEYRFDKFTLSDWHSAHQE